MENSIIKQFKGFIETFPLWYDSGPFGIEQFVLPSISFPFPLEVEILNEVPSLNRNYVLGKRMESLLSYLIRRSDDFNLLTENLQIRQDKITIGEIDFLIEDKRNDVILHIEMVYKFYVYDPSFENEVERWIGPNRRDNLLQKIIKLKEQQFPLLNHPETTQAIHTIIKRNRSFEQKVCFKAQLFLPRDWADKSFPLLNNSCLSGYWIHLQQFVSEKYSGYEFQAPKKQDWPINPVENQKWHSYISIYEKVQEWHKKQISPLIWMRSSQGIFERFFIVWW